MKVARKPKKKLKKLQNFFPHAVKIELYYIYLPVYLSLEVKAQAEIDMFHTYCLFKDNYSETSIKRTPN